MTFETKRRIFKWYFPTFGIVTLFATVFLSILPISDYVGIYYLDFEWWCWAGAFLLSIVTIYLFYKTIQAWVNSKWVVHVTKRVHSVHDHTRRTSFRLFGTILFFVSAALALTTIIIPFTGSWYDQWAIDFANRFISNPIYADQLNIYFATCMIGFSILAVVGWLIRSHYYPLKENITYDWVFKIKTLAQKGYNPFFNKNSKLSAHYKIRRTDVEPYAEIPEKIAYREISEREQSDMLKQLGSFLNMTKVENSSVAWTKRNLKYRTEEDSKIMEHAKPAKYNLKDFMENSHDFDEIIERAMKVGKI